VIEFLKYPRLFKNTYCSSRRKKAKGQTKIKMGDSVMYDARKLGESNWRNAARNRDSWQKLLRKALAQKVLLCQ
jgi:hypothetical protein